MIEILVSCCHTCFMFLYFPRYLFISFFILFDLLLCFVFLSVYNINIILIGLTNINCNINLMGYHLWLLRCRCCLLMMLLLLLKLLSFFVVENMLFFRCIRVFVNVFLHLHARIFVAHDDNNIVWGGKNIELMFFTLIFI